MALRQMAESMHGWHLLSLDTRVEQGSTRLGFRTTLVSHIYKRFRHIYILYISSNVLKFVDDTKLYLVVDNQLDGHMLQRDLNVLSKWTETWKMSFIVDTCKALHYDKGNVEYKYSMKKR